MQGLYKELELRLAKTDSSLQYDTLYIGGGTPSLLQLRELESLFSHIHNSVHLRADTEITIEVNPESLSRSGLNRYRDLGINRISIGIQSFRDRELRYLERIHSAKEALQAFEMARSAGFANISIDLIYALPGQTAEDWRFSLERAISLNPEHVSAYNLIFEEGTPFFERRQRGDIQARDAEEEYAFFNLTMDVLEDAGYGQYEISNYARSQAYYSRHNYKYWDHVPYIGFGPSAHSFWNNERWSNVRSLTVYLDQLDHGTLPEVDRERLRSQVLAFENVFLKLRTTEGINLRLYEERFQHSFEDTHKALIQNLVAGGLAVSDHEHFRLTRKGLCICDEILANFYPD